MNSHEHLPILLQPTDQQILDYLEIEFEWDNPVGDLKETILAPIIQSEIKNGSASTPNYKIRFAYENLGAGLNFDESKYPKTQSLSANTLVYKISNFNSGITHYYSSEGMYLATKSNN